MKSVVAIFSALVLAATLSGCQTDAEIIKERADKVKACVDNGGEWYNTPGWGEACNFDSRKDK